MYPFAIVGGNTNIEQDVVVDKEGVKEDEVIARDGVIEAVATSAVR